MFVGALLAFALVIAPGCSDRGLADSPDLAFESCESIGGQCLAQGSCPADEQPIEGQAVAFSYCSDAINLTCCIPRCPPTLTALLGRPCRLGSPICSYPQGPTDCGFAVCEPYAGGPSWSLYTSACEPAGP